MECCPDTDILGSCIHLMNGDTDVLLLLFNYKGDTNAASDQASTVYNLKKCRFLLRDGLLWLPT